MKKNLFSKNLIIFSLIAFAFFIDRVYAQIMPQMGNQLVVVEMSVSPENPRPDQDISISLVSYSVNLDSSTIRWYVDNTLKKEGIGLKSFNSRTGKGGELINIRATILTNDGRDFEQTIIINPAEVDLIVEATSYVPPIYKGRAYFVSQGIAKIIAIPNVIQNDKKVDAKKLNYKWRQNGIVLGGQSGAGKNTLTVEGSVPVKDLAIDLEVIDMSGKTVATESVLISPHKPTIIFYEDSSLYGVLSNKAVMDDYKIGGKEEIKIVARPFFFDLSGVSTNESKYKWSVNGKTTTLAGRKNEIILRQDGKINGGTATVSLTIENQIRIFQYATGNFNINFGN